MRIFENIDNMQGMEKYKDILLSRNTLAIVDPPYGIGEHGGKYRGRKADNYNRIVIHEKKNWDKEKPGVEYFNELFRVSKNQVIWGGNYFTNNLPVRMGWIYWDKRIGGDFSDGELAWTSFNRALRQFTYSYHGDTKGGHLRIHPTQKPVPLYLWILQNYAQKGDLILDTHVGSASSLIACEKLGFDYIGFELDKDYYDAAVKRINDYRSQPDLFLDKDEPIKPEQLKIDL